MTGAKAPSRVLARRVIGDHAMGAMPSAKPSGHKTALESYKRAVMPPPSPFGSETFALMSHRHVLSQASASDDSDDEELLLEPTVVRDSHIKKFRLSASRYLLTYAQCPEDPEDIFLKLDTRRVIKQAVGCIELHEDGNPHVHIAVEYEKKLNSVDPAYFDYAYDVGYDNYHPNFSPAKSWGACVNYCRGKEKTLVQLFQWKCSFQEAVDSAKVEKIDLFGKARAFERDEEGWIQYCHDHRVSFQYCSKIWEIVNRGTPVQVVDVAFEPSGPPPATYDPRFAFMVLPADFSRAIVLCGPSGIGKTVWAVNQLVAIFGRGLQVGDIDDLKLLRTDMRFLLFDEIRFNGCPRTGKGQWPLEKQIALCDTERARSIRCRHTNASIPANMPRVFTCTEYLPFTKDYQVERRITVINMYLDRDLEALWPPMYTSAF